MKSLSKARRERKRRLPKMRRQSSDHFDFGGGLNLIDSPLSVQPGQCSGAINYEMGFTGGYRRIDGYAIFDGRPDADTDYDLLAYGAASRFRKDLDTGNRIQQVGSDINGATAAGELLAFTEEGGFGVDYGLHSEDFENAYWTNRNVTVTNDDELWTGGETPTLNKITESVDTVPDQHEIKVVTGTLDIVAGQSLYLSVYARFTEGQVEQIQLGYAVGDGPQAFHKNPAATFDLKRGTIPYSAGCTARMTALGGGVWHCYLLTDMAIVAENNIKWYLELAKQVDPADAIPIVSYIGTGRYVHASGYMAVVPEDNATQYDFDNDAPLDLTTVGSLGYWKQENTVVVHDDLAWPTGSGYPVESFYDPYDYFNKISDDATDGVHLLAQQPNTPSTSEAMARIFVGDTVYGELYVHYTTDETERVLLRIRGASWVGYGSGQEDAYVIYDIKNRTVLTLGDAIASAGIADVAWGFDTSSFPWAQIDATTMKLWFITKAALVKNWTQWLVQMAEPVTHEYSYAGAGNYFHATGARLVVRDQTQLSPNNILPMGYVEKTTAAKNVKSGNLIMAPVTGGPFVDDEDLDVSSTVFSQAVGANVVNGESDAALDAAYGALAQAAATSALAVPGSGPVRGVWMHEGTVYAFRDNTGGTQCDMWESTAGGWVQVTLNDVVHFDAGDGTEPSEGDTLDGVSSTATAAIKRIVKTSGTWGVDAAGYFVLGTVTNGPYTNDEVLNVSAARVADADGASAVPTLVAGGRYEFRSENFYGHESKHRMYGVDGKNYGFEYDKDEGVFTQIETGMTTDTPIHLAVHNGHLFYGFPGGSVQLSGDGAPLSWTVITGATEIGIGDEISGFNEEVGNSLFIFSRNSTFVLQGNTRANFDLDDFNINAGAAEGSLQRIGLGCYFDDRGFTTILQTQRSGSVNFQENTVSELIQPLVKELVDDGVQVRCSHLLRNQNIYRCYFEDGRVISIGFRGHKVSGHMPLEYDFIANVACSEEDTDGSERIFVGDDDGFVYELEKGTSFAGNDINYYMRTVLYHSKSPGRFKKYSQARIDATLSGALTLYGQFEYDFHDDSFNLGEALDFSTDEAGGYWDEFTWDEFVWDKPTSGIPQEKLEGEGVNIAAYLYGQSKIDKSHTLRGVTLQWMPRRDDRRN